jgi:hypothetical protein
MQLKPASGSGDTKTVFAENVGSAREVRMIEKLGKRQAEVLKTAAECTDATTGKAGYMATAEACGMIGIWGPKQEFFNAVWQLQQRGLVECNLDCWNESGRDILVTPSGRAALAEQEAGTDG